MVFKTLQDSPEIPEFKFESRADGDYAVIPEARVGAGQGLCMTTSCAVVKYLQLFLPDEKISITTDLEEATGRVVMDLMILEAYTGKKLALSMKMPKNQDKLEDFIGLYAGITTPFNSSDGYDMDFFRLDKNRINNHFFVPNARKVKADKQQEVINSIMSGKVDRRGYVFPDPWGFNSCLTKLDKKSYRGLNGEIKALDMARQDLTYQNLSTGAIEYLVMPRSLDLASYSASLPGSKCYVLDEGLLVEKPKESQDD